MPVARCDNAVKNCNRKVLGMGEKEWQTCEFRYFVAYLILNPAHQLFLQSTIYLAQRYVINSSWSVE